MHTVMTDIIVIGTASLDILHIGGQTAHTMGGAGLYTALAAYCSGAGTGLLAPRPEPMPPLLQPLATRIHWWGPSVTLTALPRLEIVHHGEGRATLLNASWGAESRLTPATLPAQVTQATLVHIAALRSAQRQFAFVQAIRARRGAIPTPRISVGTYARLVYGETAWVRRIFEYADIFFMNENEAKGLFGRIERARTRPDALLFITLGACGALVITGNDVVHVPGQATVEVDPWCWRYILWGVFGLARSGSRSRSGGRTWCWLSRPNRERAGTGSPARGLKPLGLVPCVPYGRLLSFVAKTPIQGKNRLRNDQRVLPPREIHYACELPL